MADKLSETRRLILFKHRSHSGDECTV